MNRLCAGLLACAALLCATGSATAQDFGPHSNVGIAVKASTLGFGADLAVPIASRANVRLGVNAFSLSHDFDNDGINLAANLKLRSVSAGLDWFPFGGGFHLSPGLMIYNGNKLSALATVAGGESFDLGDEELFSNSANPVVGTATIDFKKVAPMFTLGWGNIVPRGDRRWSIPFELGIVYSRAPMAVLSLSGSACTRNGVNCRNIATDPTLQADLAKEQVNLNADLEPLKVFPILSLGFSYKF